jgi:plastocyanin
VKPSVTVANQEISGDGVIVAKVVSGGPGWLAIHAQADDKPGPILGYSQVAEGTNTDVRVEISVPSATETLYAMLHTDAGEVGTWEFPEGPDVPVLVDEQVVAPPFNVTGGLAEPEEILPSVTVVDQDITGGIVAVSEVVSAGPGWLVIHAQADGKPGPVLGYSQVVGGANAKVQVEIDAGNATETLYAMLHTDAGDAGVWEFPDGPDTPTTVDEQVIAPAFKVTAGLAPSQEIEPAVTALDQRIADGKVTIQEVVSAGPGWLVIHAQADGKPGPIVGYSPVAAGANSNVVVELDLSAATVTLYAMLHEDGGQVGNWEFPDGPDTPVMVNGQVVSPAFKLRVLSDDEAEVEMEDFQFKPKVLVIRVGTAVKFSNRDEAEHTATSDTGVWDSGYLAKGEEFSFTFTEPGEYPYYCIPHGAPGGQGMSATVIVLK